MATITPKKKYSIPEAAEAAGVSQPYIRTLIREGKLSTERVPIAIESRVTKHMILGSDLIQFLENTPRKSRRSDGRTKFIFYATPAELATIHKALTDVGLKEVDGLIRTANHIKPYGATTWTQ